jgi:hypothetical protein
VWANSRLCRCCETHAQKRARKRGRQLQIRRKKNKPLLSRDESTKNTYLALGRRAHVIRTEQVDSNSNSCNSINGHSDGPVVSVLAIEPKFRGFKPDRDGGFLRAIELRTLSFGEEVKPSSPCRKILRHVKEPFEV